MADLRQEMNISSILHLTGALMEYYLEGIALLRDLYF